MPPNDWYRHLVERARKLDPMVIVGAPSRGEIDRMEKLVDQLEEAAAKKAAEAAEQAANEPEAIARAERQRAEAVREAARLSVMKMQAEWISRGIGADPRASWPRASWPRII